MNTFLTWENFKNIVVYKQKIRFIEFDLYYDINYKDQGGIFETTIIKTNNLECEDFETNYKIFSNKNLEDPRDLDGTILTRNKITSSGWHYQLHGIEFETSKLNSIYSKQHDNTDYGFSSIKFYELINSSEVEITGDNLNQSYLDTKCIKTIVDWEPTYDYEILGAMLKQTLVPTTDIRLWTIGVPDIPEAFGGSKLFATSVNLKYIGLEDGVRVDGRAPKFLQYNQQLHTNKIRLTFRHDIGYNHKIHMIFEIFKA